MRSFANVVVATVAIAIATFAAWSDAQCGPDCGWPCVNCAGSCYNSSQGGCCVSAGNQELFCPASDPSQVNCCFMPEVDIPFCCAENTTCCGSSQCCASNETCVDGMCCPSGTKGACSDQCCPDNTVCVDDTCCPLNTTSVCVDTCCTGDSTCCTTYPTSYSQVCCNSSQTCVTGDYFDEDIALCCDGPNPSMCDGSCCNGGCCQSGQSSQCCESPTSVCCYPSGGINDVNCCPDDSSCCASIGGTACCPTNSTCCVANDNSLSWCCEYSCGTQQYQCGNRTLP